MTQEYRVLLPKLGESIVSATVVQWFKQVGDFVRLDEALLEVSTDKVNSEIPAPVAGYVSQILANPDEEIQVGALLAVITLSERAMSAPVNTSFLSPAILRMANEAGVSMQELGNIPATGAEGRLTKKDLETYLFAKQPAESAGEVIKLTGMRKAIAQQMVRAASEIPHATLIHEIDVTALTEYIEKKKESFKKAHGVKLTITCFIAKAIAETLKSYPLLNATMQGDTLTLKKEVNLGIAVSIDHGLIVPVIRGCERKSLEELAISLHQIVEKARLKTLSPDDVANGSFTLTNFGISGVKIGLPIIRAPEVAILGIGSISKQVSVIENDEIAIRKKMHVCLAFDHRVIDGMYGCGFLALLQNWLESSFSR